MKEGKLQWQQETRKQWNERSQFWNSKSTEMWETGSRSKIISFFARHVKKHALVADIGCGDGYGSFKLYKEGYHVHGVDISDEMIRLAKKHETETLVFTQASIFDMRLSKDSFDAILSINCLEWTEDPLFALNCLHRILKPNGFLCIGILGPTAQPRKNSYSRLYGENVICNTIMPWELEQLAKENGWEQIDGYGVYKRGVSEKHAKTLPVELRQALSFMWVFMMRKKENV